VRSSTAPAGQHTDVEIIVKLASGTTKIYAWQSPMGLAQAYHQAPRWAREELTREQVKGRSRIVGINVEVQYKAGVYRK
jgi:hypothetical protein